MTIEYAIQQRDGETVCCDSCHCPAPTHGFDWGVGTPKYGREKRDLCEFCSTTMASRYTEYPTREGFTALRAEIWTAAGAIFNMLKASKGD